MLPVRRDLDRGAELLRLLVDVEALLVRPRELAEQTHGGAAVHGVEVAAILGLGGVGEAEADEVLAHDHLVLAVDDVERVVVDRALAEGPAALVEVALLLHLQDAPVALVGADLELVVLAVLAQVLAAHAVDEEDLGGLEVADERRRAVRAADGVLAAHAAALVGRAVVVGRVADHRVLGARRMLELEPLGAEALGLRDGDAGALEAVGPEPDRIGRDGEVQEAGLLRAALAHPAGLAVREAREEGAGVAHLVAVVEVVDRHFTVEEDRLLHHLQTEGLDVEVVVLLGTADAERQMVGASDRALGRGV